MPLTKPGSNFYPAVHLNYAWLGEIAGQNGKQVERELESIRDKIGKACSYPWDNSHFYICDITGTPVLTVHVNGDSLHLWAANGGHSIGEWSISALTKEQARKIVDEVSNGNFLCPDCGKWKDASKKKTYSFAGAVCPKCYNPKRHLPPDTRGD